jgi:hypothetical protein
VGGGGLPPCGKDRTPTKKNGDMGAEEDEIRDLCNEMSASLKNNSMKKGLREGTNVERMPWNQVY